MSSSKYILPFRYEYGTCFSFVHRAVRQTRVYNGKLLARKESRNNLAFLHAPVGANNSRATFGVDNIRFVFNMTATPTSSRARTALSFKRQFVRFLLLGVKRYRKTAASWPFTPRPLKHVRRIDNRRDDTPDPYTVKRRADVILGVSFPVNC